MTVHSGISELRPLAGALRTLSEASNHRELSERLLDAALAYLGSSRGAVELSEDGELLGRVDASFPRERTRISTSTPAGSGFVLPDELAEAVIDRQQRVVTMTPRAASPLGGASDGGADTQIDVMCLPLVLQRKTIGVVYVEAAAGKQVFTQQRAEGLEILAFQAISVFAVIQLFEALRETNMWMLRGQQIGRMGSYRWNTRTRLSRGTREAHRILGLDPAVNPVPFETYRARIHPDDLGGLDRALALAAKTRSPFSHEYRVVHQDGAILHVFATGQFDVGPSGDLELEGVLLDVTERKAAEQALLAAQTELSIAARLASLGELAGSIVHEINQPLTAMTTSAEACLRWLGRGSPDLDEMRQSLTRVIEQGHRASSVVSGLRSLVREEQLAFGAVSMIEIIEEVLLFIRRDLQTASVAVQTDFDVSVPRIEVDRTQIQQVLLNLLRNAVDAMMSNPDGRARIISIVYKMIDDQVLLTVRDNGAGIEPEPAARLFQALFTTKDGGLGLGLSISRRIVNAHGGRLWLEESSGNGSVFAFTIPLRQPSPTVEGPLS